MSALWYPCCTKEQPPPSGCVYCEADTPASLIVEFEGWQPPDDSLGCGTCDDWNTTSFELWQPSPSEVPCLYEFSGDLPCPDYYNLLRLEYTYEGVVCTIGLVDVAEDLILKQFDPAPPAENPYDCSLTVRLQLDGFDPGTARHCNADNVIATVTPQMPAP